MSVISTWVATPNRIRILYDFLERSASGEDRDKLEQLAGPAPLTKQIEDPEEPSSTTTVAGSISEAVSLGLFLDDNGRLTARSLDRDLTKSIGRDRAYAHMIEQLLLNVESPGAELQTSFAYALSWLLCQSPLEPMLFSGSQFERLTEQLAGDDFFQLKSVANWQAFCYWARSLGYCTFLKINDRLAIYPDPTQAVARHLAQVLPRVGSARASDLSALLSSPGVFDGGIHRRKIDARFKESRNLPSRISQSLSLALLRLENSGKLMMTQLADGDSRTLDFGDKTRPITHISMGDKL